MHTGGRKRPDPIWEGVRQKIELERRLALHEDVEEMSLEKGM